MRQLAQDVWQLDGRPPDMVNVYVVGDVLIDAGTRYDEGRILRQLRGRTISAHALTHAHPDHLGSSHAGPVNPVARRLSEGDEVAGFQVLDTPGHTAGQVAFWRESDRTLITGDVLWNFQFAGGRPGLTQPIPPVNWDSAVNRDSARRLAALEPALVCFGHGPAMRDTRRFVQVVEALPTP